jgi:hypothetical protein
MIRLAARAWMSAILLTPFIEVLQLHSHISSVLHLHSLLPIIALPWMH